MKHPLLVSMQVAGLLVGGFAVDTSVLEQKIWTELKYQAVRYVSLVEPEARRAWNRLWHAPD
jgi:hypothetical protein